jgi:hypothetical protein
MTLISLLLEIIARRRHAWCGGASMHGILGEKQWGIISDGAEIIF